MESRILVYGCGVIGSVYAIRFAKAGFSVSVLARGERLAALRAGGLRIRNVILGEEEAAPVELLDSLPSERDYDLVILAVRSGQVESALRDIARLPGGGSVLAVGNNLGDYDVQAAVVGPERLVLGFGAFGGYREGGVIAYVDGRTRERPEPGRRSPTTLGIVSEAARPALEAVGATIRGAGLPTTESEDIASWLVCHAALVFPLAGAMFAAGGEQARVCRTRDALVLGIRAVKELVRALGRLGYRVEPVSLRRLAAMPEPILARTLGKSLAGEGARVAMFGHALAPGGRSEIGGQAAVLDGIVRKAGLRLPSWERLLPYFPADSRAEPIPDGSRRIRLRLW